MGHSKQSTILFSHFSLVNSSRLYWPSWGLTSKYFLRLILQQALYFSASSQVEVEICGISDPRHCYARLLLLHLSVGAFPMLTEMDYEVQQWSGHLELHVKCEKLFLLQLDRCLWRRIDYRR